MDPIGREQPPRAALLTLKLKNFMIIMFEIPSYEDAKLAAITIETLANISEFTNLTFSNWV